uniref:Uncharacterized protein n=1 Tax=Tanacetum cinerariifolium TaxID=118510 RepID=A0A6L2K8B5_TANCI|nr:hypothetical protein [Tanacetum cinerariifolium]
MSYMQQPMQNPKDISDPTTTFDMALQLMSKEFQLNNTTTTNNNQRSSSNPYYSQIAQLGAYDETESDNANCTLGNNLQQASIYGTQSDKAPVYDIDGSAEVSSKEQGEETIQQHSANIEETRAYHESLFHNLAAEVKKVNSFLKEETKFVQDCKSLAKEADESFDKHKALELEIECLLRVDAIFPKVGETNALSNQVTSNLVPSSQEPNDVKNDNVIFPGIFRMNPCKASMVENFMPNKHVKASVRTKLITISQTHVITKNDVNSKTNDFSPKDVKSTTKTRRPLPRNNTKNDKVPSKPKSSRLLNNLEKIEENHRNLQSSSNKKHMSSECNNIKLAIRNAKSEVVCAMCK